MARNTSTVYLGYEDEPVTEKNKHLVDYTTNKVGGLPAWPSTDITVTGCPICGLRRPLVLQIYAPLDNSPFHRMLYLFACVNAVCSNQSRGWLCVRVQHIERHHSPAAADEQKQVRAAPNINWCSGADDWGDADGGFGAVGGAEVSEVCCGGDATAAEDDNCNEPNGNVVNSRTDNRSMSDEEDDETNSLENDPVPAFGQLQLADDNDRNANGGARKMEVCGGDGAVGRLNSPNASAEIEGEESELVTIDAPVVPKRDLIALLKQTTAVPSDPGKIMLRGFFVAVEREERITVSADGGGAAGGAMGEHIRELLQDYQRKDEKLNTSPSSPDASGGGVAAGGAVGGCESEEKYEKGIPIHGDMMFHNFVTTIQENPGQILRYSRDSLPLLVAPLPDMRLPPCENCGGPMLCEMQLLPTIIPKLRFAGNGDAAPLEFGNVLVFTCQKSCWDTPDRMRTEQIVVQQEI